MSGTRQEQKSEHHQKAKEAEERNEKAQQKMDELEKDPPEKIEDWPDDAAKYRTFGGPEEGEVVYDEKHEEALGEHSVRHLEDGSVEVKGEKVDNPDDYKGDPIPGGPTDPDAPKLAGEKGLSEKKDEKDEKDE